MEQFVIVISSFGEVNTTIGIFHSELEAQVELSNLEQNWILGGQAYYGEIIPFNSIESRSIRVSADGTLFLGDN